MPFRCIVLILSQLTLVSLLPARVQLVSDPSTALTYFSGPVADFNGDGIPDIANLNQECNCLVVWLGEGNGLFKPVFQQPGTFGYALFAGDVNLDGKLDIISVPLSGELIGVSLGNGDGTFRPQVVSSLPFIVTGVALGDLNGDEIPDVLVSHDGNVLTPFIGRSNGTYIAWPNITVAGQTSCGSFAIADFNRDHNGDFAWTCGGALETQIFYGDGDGSFLPSPQLIATGEQSVASAEDINGDGYPDLVTQSGDGFSVFVNEGNGTFMQSFQTDLDGGMAFGDVNNDGKVDMIVAPDWGPPQYVFVLAGNGDGTFQDPTQYAVSGGLYSSSNVFLRDANADGIPDILVSTSSALCVLVGTGDGNFLQPVTPEIGTAGETLIVATADFNHDGLSDLVFQTPNSANPLMVDLRVALNQGSNSFAPSLFVSSIYRANTALTTTISDLNRDGNADIIAISASGFLETALSNADGTFQPTVPIARLVEIPRQVVAADFNGDGNPDIAVIVAKTDLNASNNVSNYVSLEIFWGRGDGTVGAPTSTIIGPGLYASMAVGDFNGDGHPDIAISNNSSLMVLTNSGSGSFTRTFGRTVDYGVDLAAGDLNQDGLADLVITTDSNQITELISDGAGGFSQSIHFPVGDAPDSILIADLNGDGYPEVLTNDVNSQDISVLNNDGGTLSYGGSWFAESFEVSPILVGHFFSSTSLSVIESDTLLKIRDTAK